MPAALVLADPPPMLSTADRDLSFDAHPCPISSSMAWVRCAIRWKAQSFPNIKEFLFGATVRGFDADH